MLAGKTKAHDGPIGRLAGALGNAGRRAAVVSRLNARPQQCHMSIDRRLRPPASERSGAQRSVCTARAFHTQQGTVLLGRVSPCLLQFSKQSNLVCGISSRRKKRLTNNFAPPMPCRGRRTSWMYWLNACVWGSRCGILPIVKTTTKCRTSIRAKRVSVLLAFAR